MRNLIFALFKTGSSSIARLLFNMASIKIIAISLGPSGLGLYSIIRQAMFTFGSVGSGGQTAIVQGISSRDSSSAILIFGRFFGFSCVVLLSQWL